MNTYDEVIDHFGSKSSLAKSLGISPSAVTQWDGIIPKSRCYEIESLTKGRFDAQNYLASVEEAA